MATKKPSTSRALAPWEQKMIDAAARQSKVEKTVSGVQAISTRGGILAIDKKPIKGNELLVIVLASIHFNEWYADKEFNADKPYTPPCYAYGDNSQEDPEDGMRPHPDAEDKQSEDGCKTCWANEWASATKGRGKACKNVRKLAVLTADAGADEEAMATGEMRTLKIPVMSVANWAEYVKETLSESMNRPFWAVVTRVSLTPDPKSQFRMNFEFDSLLTLDQKLFDALEKRRLQAEKALLMPLPKFSDEEDEAPAKPVKGQGARAVPAKKAAPPAKKAPATKTAAPAKRASKY